MTESDAREAAAMASPGAGMAKHLRVAITSPFVWPWVRRGSERILHDLARYLAGRGHQVTVFSSGPKTLIEDRDGIAYHLLAQKHGSRWRQFNSCHRFAFDLQPVLRSCDPDVVFCMNYFDAYAAIQARKQSGARYKVVFHSAGILSRRYFRAVPLDAWFFRTVLREADQAVAVSQFASDVFRRDFGTHAKVLYPAINVEDFQPGPHRESAPMQAGPCILFAGDADERRKGARALCRAFPAVRERYPDATLVFAGNASTGTRTALIREVGPSDAAGHITFLGVGKVEDLPALYREASVTVLPSVGESFGMVLVESLAAGTPVVGSRHGGPTEIINTDLVGRLFDPGEFVDQTDNVQGLVAALLEVLARGKTPEVIAACRSSAQRYSWAALGPLYEGVLLDLVDAHGGNHQRPEATARASEPY